MSENREIYTTVKNFTLPPAVTALTNLTSVLKMQKSFMVEKETLVITMCDDFDQDGKVFLGCSTCLLLVQLSSRCQACHVPKALESTFRLREGWASLDNLDNFEITAITLIFMPQP